MNFVVIIPARLASTRLPNKMLANIAGKPLIYHTWHNACKSKASEVIIACDNQQIYDACTQFSAKVILTTAHHSSGTERLAEACKLLQLDDEQIVVNVQGDEPLIPHEFINQVAQNLANTKADIATLANVITDKTELFNPNVVKVVLNHQDFALNFSRAPMPWDRESFSSSDDNLPTNYSWLRHIGIYAYKASFIQTYINLAACDLENCEKLEQLRALWHGYQIHVQQVTQVPPAGVDNADDLTRVRNILEHS